MSAKVIPFGPVSRSSASHLEHGERHLLMSSTPDSPEALYAEVSRLERLDRDLQVQSHRINLSIGEIRRERLVLLRRIAQSRSA